MTDSVEWGSFTEQLEYLTKRGLDRFSIQKLGLEIVTPTKLEAMGYKLYPGITRAILWYLKDLRGDATGKTGARIFYGKGFISPENDDRPKFLPPKGQVPGVYFSPLSDWNRLEYGQRIYICESYLKADIIGMLGLHAVGVSGCWGWSHQKELNWDFYKIPWKDSGLVPVALFDSDVCEENPRLWQSVLKLRAEFDVRLHVEAEALVLPGGVDSKTGVDDFYVANGRDATIAFLEGETVALPNELKEYLKIMNSKVCVIRDIGRFVDIELGTLMGRGQFEDINYADWMADNSEGKRVPVAKIWTRWDGRSIVDTLDYRPGEKRFGTDEHGRKYFNLWKGMGCEPKANEEASCLFFDWVRNVFPREEEMNFFLNWWAWQLQNLGEKLTTSLVVVGVPGIGKGWITALAEIIWGEDNIAKVPLTVLEKHFNAEVSAKQLLIVEEADEVGRGIIYNKLKDMVTSSTIRLERKGVDATTIRNTLNIFLTGNQVGIFKLDKNDRRFAVLEASNWKRIANDPDYWEPRWTKSMEVACAVYHDLMKRDLSDFNPHGEAPLTQAKKDMVEVTHSPIEQWVSEMWGDIEDIVVQGQVVDGRIISAKEAMWCYLDGQVPMHEIDRGQVLKMNTAFKNAGIPVANGGNKIKCWGLPTRFFLLRGNDYSENWTAEAENRGFWKRLVASTQGRVASENAGGNLSSKY